MPRGDKTGPLGAGPMTGRGAGYCAGFDQPGFANGDFIPMGRAWECGGGRGGGRGRGYRNRAFWNVAPAWGPGCFGGGPYGPVAGPAPSVPADASELDYLKRQSKHLEQSLRRVQARLEELEKGSE